MLQTINFYAILFLMYYREVGFNGNSSKCNIN
jgi:hypothetical protein